MAEDVGGAADVEQSAGLVPVDDLAPDDTHLVETADADGGFDEALHGVGIERGIVVEQQHEVGLGRRGLLHGLAERAREAAGIGQRDHAALAEGLLQDLLAVVVRTVVDTEHRHARV